MPLGPHFSHLRILKLFSLNLNYFTRSCRNGIFDTEKSGNRISKKLQRKLVRKFNVVRLSRRERGGTYSMIKDARVKCATNASLRERLTHELCSFAPLHPFGCTCTVFSLIFIIRSNFLRGNHIISHTMQKNKTTIHQCSFFI